MAAAEAAILYNLPRIRTSPEVDAAYTPYDLRLAFYLTYNPNVYFDIRATRQRKHRAIDCYTAQFTPTSMAELHILLEAAERRAGLAGGCEYAEPLKLLHPWQLHIHSYTAEM